MIPYRDFPLFPVLENLSKVVLCLTPFEFVPLKENFETKSIMPGSGHIDNLLRGIPLLVLTLVVSGA
jgi:hypothetical protein